MSEFLFKLVTSSVAKMGGSIPYWPEMNAKYRVFSSFEADFCSKNENSPAPNEIGVRAG